MISYYGFNMHFSGFPLKFILENQSKGFHNLLSILGSSLGKAVYCHVYIFIDCVV